jgi:glycerophosphoryl diester phosphodiesterase
MTISRWRYMGVMDLSARHRTLHVHWLYLFTVIIFTVTMLSPTTGFSQRMPAYPPSPAISSVWFDMASLVELAPGSDNWPVTWAADDRQYTSWGDGGGFGGSNTVGRVSYGVGVIDGGPRDYRCQNLWGGAGLPKPPYGGKSYGVLALTDTLWLWRGGDASDENIYDFQELYRSTDNGKNWQFSGVRFDRHEFSDTLGVFALTFLQFGMGAAGSRDDYVYMYAPRAFNLVWNAQIPGEIHLLRAPRGRLMDKKSYEWFTGLDGNGTPRWSDAYHRAIPVFHDPVNGVMRTSVTYNPDLGRYILSTQQVSRFRDQDGHIGIYDAAEPWGPWTTVLFANAFELGLVDFTKTVFFNFSNKWTTSGGRKSVLVYTNRDNWATVESEYYVKGEYMKIGHRGASGLSPENTLAAFNRAVELGVDMVELDVHMSSDGEVVVIHDKTVERTTDGTGSVADMKFNQLQKLDAGGGERIPSLDQVLLQIGDKCRVNVELKGAGTAAPVADILRRFVRRHGIAWENFVVSAFDHTLLAELKEIEPRIRRAPLFRKELSDDYIATAHRLGAWSVNLHRETVTGDIVERCHRAGLRVLVYTVNEPDEIVRLKEMGVDGIFCDYPDRL